LRRTAARRGLRDGQGDLNVHRPSLVLDGVFTRPPVTAAPACHALPAATDHEIALP
jgi:hypothetical protein